ncbi:uncharacterized protein GO595_008081 [Histomonas meleagridis]|uniref:uncharacterized protein n=1 Tax=Histomonas meleagridis TaxID=135588 RepID=UPI003559B392|nr:hypothetical protein GO595_008081 [Histomonas meleagridis]
MFALLFACALQYEDVIEIPEGLSNADACSICKTVVGGIAGFIGASPVQSVIKQLALGLCGKFSGSGNTLCKNIVNKLPTILSYLSKRVSQRLTFAAESTFASPTMKKTTKSRYIRNPRRS